MEPDRTTWGAQEYADAINHAATPAEAFELVAEVNEKWAPVDDVDPHPVSGSASLQVSPTMVGGHGGVRSSGPEGRSMRRRARLDGDGTLRCRKCGSRNLLARSDERAKKTRSLKCADCDERQLWRGPAVGAA